MHIKNGNLNKLYKLKRKGKSCKRITEIWFRLLHSCSSKTEFGNIMGDGHGSPKLWKGIFLYLPSIIAEGNGLTLVRTNAL